MDYNFVDWSYLGTFAGTLAAVLVITQMIKDMPLIQRIPTQIMSWVMAYVIILLVQVFTDAFTAQGAVLGIFNAALVSLAANGGFDAIKRMLGGTYIDEDESTEE